MRTLVFRVHDNLQDNRKTDCRLPTAVHHPMDMSNENDQADRAISTGKLHALLHFHTRPINVVVFHGSQGILVFRWVSRLDAFSGYPVRI